MEKLQIDIKPKLVSDYRKAPFDIAKKELESHKPRFLVCSIADLTDLRLQEGSASDVSQEGSSVTSGIDDCKNKVTFSGSRPQAK